LVNCLGCNKPIPETRKYCSIRCGNIHRNKQRKGKTLEEIYGPEKTKYLRETQYKKVGQISKERLLGKTYEQLYGERSTQIKEKKNNSISVSQIKTWKKPQVREKRINGMKKALENPECHKRHSEGAKRMWNRSGHREKMNQSMERYRDGLSEEEKLNHKKKLKEVWRKKWSDPTYRKEQSQIKSQQTRKRLLEHPETHPNRILAKKNRQGTTYIEILMGKILDSAKVEYDPQHPITYAKGSGCVKFVDFYLPNHKLCIECDGEEWHKDKKADEERDKIILSVLGSDWEIKHVPGKEIFEFSKFFGIK
jgi:very-short-patch-repair endonuclease